MVEVSVATYSTCTNALLIEAGNDASYNWTVIDLLEPERTYIFSAYDYGTEEIYDSEPIFVHAALTPNVRGRWVARQF